MREGYQGNRAPDHRDKLPTLIGEPHADAPPQPERKLSAAEERQDMVLNLILDNRIDAAEALSQKSLNTEQPAPAPEKLSAQEAHQDRVLDALLSGNRDEAERLSRQSRVS